MEGLWLVSYITLWGMVLLEAIVIAALLRQIGLLHLRVQPVGARTMNPGPEIGTQLPMLQAEDIFGRQVTVVGQGRARLLLFVSPTCSACEEMVRGAKTLARTEKGRIDVVLLTTVTDAEINRAYVEKHQLTTIPYIASPQIADTIGVREAPYALAADAMGVVQAKGLANHIEHLESLVEALVTGHATTESYLAATNRRGSREQ